MIIKTIGIVGSGTMGSGIAQVAALAHFEVILHDSSTDALKVAMERIKDAFRHGVTQGRITATEATEALSCIHPRRNFGDAGDADFIIEAAVEKLTVKQEIFGRLDAIVAPHVILASTTSSLSITTIASATKTPESVIGMHFFNPPIVMKLVEVVQGTHTSAETVKATYDLALKMEKVPVVCKDSPGFLVNRISRPFCEEALRLFDQGVTSVQEIDRIVKLEGGFTTGPFELMDLIGIDENYAVTESLYEQFNHEPRFQPHPLQRKMVGSGTLGRKTKKGFYRYK